MAAAAAAAAAAASTSKLMRVGKKQVFLPDHMITFLRPEEKQPPSFATFKVPLTFNKLDLRDYLQHAYGVRTLGVRSQLRQQRPRRSKVHGRITRPPPIKTMTVELARPFVWPARPEGAEAREPWAPAREARREEQLRGQRAWQARHRKTGKMPMHDEVADTPDRVSFRREAARLLESGGWSHGRPLDPRFAAAEGAPRLKRKADRREKTDAGKDEARAEREKAEDEVD